jgi:hypothetical protein
MKEIKDYYREVSLPVTKIIKIGTSAGIVIPNYIMKEYGLDINKEVLPIFHIRERLYDDETPLSHDLKSKIEQHLKSKVKQP